MATTVHMAPCRTITPEEVAHYQEKGWVLLKRFIDPDTIATLLRKAQGIMGEDGDSNPPYGIDQPYFNAQAASGYHDPQVRPMLHGIGDAAKALMARKANVPVRLFNDFFAPKLPAARKTRNQGNGATSFHQDFITFAVDRTGGMTFWIPLEGYGPDAGTMSFIEGSHKLGVLGNYTSYDGKDIREVYPELEDLPMTEQVTYEPGDVTAHSHLTVHGAGQNSLDRPRWAYLVLPQPADARWNGAPPEAFVPDAHGMVPYGMFPDAAFPIIAE
ncbi:phytanoyl-CoA dioxygenase family protein [Novosphingobium beihaiensis]|uniref:Phytanoyl-CoA dioxygenase family protein n=1 Tax=Novosphingobium beihaiensis TaxID=2930389 RepID=A0ABT0BMU5_9SPHN|nr:phytanoyl-CoA dioxygenase family protein [Novosphingobium beihaiensis]MCJ2186285.1 phytanoyl-CoA dioxygenase family protein [Novosphingobium beihaiensis]